MAAACNEPAAGPEALVAVSGRPEALVAVSGRPEALVAVSGRPEALVAVSGRMALHRQTRVIRLEPKFDESLTGIGNAPAAGTMTIFNYNERFREEFEFTVRGLPTLRGRDVLGLYISPAESAADYQPGDSRNFRVLFNVDFNGHWHLFALLPEDTFELPTLTVFVVKEADDGREFDPSLDLGDVVLEGTSTR